MARLVAAARGGLTLASSDGALFSSRVDPVAEGERRAQACPAAPGDWLIVFGLSPIYHILALLRRDPPLARRLWVVEAHREFRSEALALLTQAAEGSAVSDSVGDFPAGHLLDTSDLSPLFEALGREGADPSRVKWLDHAHLPPPYAALSERYGEAKRKLVGWLQDQARNALTDRYFAKRWMRNGARNARRESLKFLSDYPRAGGNALLISSGPGTETCLALLAERSRAQFTMALPGPAALLHRAGVRLDAILSTDGGWWNTAHFDAVFRAYPSAALFCPFSICPAIPRGPLPSYFFFDDEAFAKEYATTAGNARIVAENWIPQAGTASAAALSVLRRLGFDRVQTAGIDFTLTPWRCHAASNITEERHFSSCSRLQPFDTLYHRAFSMGLSRIGTRWTDEKLALYARLFARQAEAEKIRIETVS